MGEVRGNAVGPTCTTKVSRVAIKLAPHSVVGINRRVRFAGRRRLGFVALVFSSARQARVFLAGSAPAERVECSCLVRR